MGYEIRLSFDKWEKFLDFMTDLHNREMRELEEMTDMEEKNFKPRFRFENLDEDEDIDELMEQYPIAFQDTSESEIKKIHLITEKMARRPKGFLKPASTITVDYILSRLKKTFSPDKFFLALPLTIAALFRIRCGEKFEEGQKRPWQDEMDLNLFLLTEYGFNSRGVKNALALLDEYNLLDIDKNYEKDKNHPRIVYRPNDELYNLLIPDEIPF